MSGDLGATLQAFLGTDNQVRNQAEQAVNQAREQDLGGFIGSLVSYARDESKDTGTRMQAITLLKNSVALDVKDKTRKRALHEGWTKLDRNLRAKVKAEILLTLGSNDKNVRYVAALCVANLARIELPANEWNDLFGILTTSAQSQNDGEVEASLTVLGYICEESNDSAELTECLEHVRGDLLNVICQGMQRNSETVQYYATNALANAMEFVHGNMSVQGERDYLMSAICGATKNNQERTRAKAMECLVKVGSLYYEYLTAYIADIAEITKTILETDSETVGLQALQFWSAVCRTEKEMKDDDETTNEFAEKALPMLTQLLFHCLLKQEDGQTEEDWNLSNAASKCLTNLAEAVGDPIMGYCMPFVGTKVESQNWRDIEAGLTCFGCIMSGPDPESLSQTVSGAYGSCLNMMSHSHENVADTAAWVVSVICENFPEVVTFGENMNALMSATGPLFTINVRMALRAARIVHHLALHFEELEDEDPQKSNELSPHYESLIHALVSSIDREPGRLRTESQEALNALIGAAAKDRVDILEQLIKELIARITKTGTQLNNEEIERAEGETYMGLLCGAMCVVVRKLENKVKAHAGDIMNIIGAVLGADTPFIQSECMGVCGAMASKLGKDYAPFIDGTVGAILKCLKNTLEDDTCISAIGAVGDLANALKGDFAGPGLESIMGLFLTYLRDKDMSDDILHAIVGCLGDIALNIGGSNFDFYITPFMAQLSAMDADAREQDLEDPDDEDYVIGLYECMCNCFSGILQGYKGNCANVAQYFPAIVKFAVYTAMELYGRSGDLFRNAVMLLGDCANVTSAEDAMIQEFGALLLGDDIVKIINKAKEDEPMQQQDDYPHWVFAEEELKNLGQAVSSGN